MKNDSLSNTYLALLKLNTTCNGIDKISNPSTNQEIIANLTAKTAEEVRSHMIQVMSNFLSTYADHLCTVAVSSISSSISAAIGNLALSMNHEISSQVVAAVTNYLKEMANTSSKSDSASLSNFDDDYVEVNESSIKEFQIPESLVKPASENRVKISTKLFVTIFGTFILPILLQFSGIFVDLQQSAAEAKTEEKRIEIEQEQNDLLREQNRLLKICSDVLSSIDTSHSSQAETIESLKKSLPKEDSSQQ